MAQEAYAFKGEEQERKLNYLLFIPGSHEKDLSKKWPVILFLHGSGERGNYPELVKKHGIPKVVEGLPTFPFIVVSPQCPGGSTWGPHLPLLNALLDHILGNYSGDPHRVYLTGISMGGNGVWQLAARFPRRFAAIAPVSGYGRASEGFPEKVCILKSVPIWVFHGARDRIVPVRESEKLVDALRGCGANVRFTKYPDCGHNCWTRTYKNPKIYRWFLSHSLPGN